MPPTFRIDFRGQRGNWYQVDIPSARRGWVRRTDVDISGRPRPGGLLGAAVWKNIRRFVGVPYYWGGLSAYRRDYGSAVTGVDCSGLTHLAYRAAGLDIPRDSHEQWMNSEPVRRADLRRGDLIFLSNTEKPDKIVHVAMYAGGEFLIEGPGTGLNVRRITFKKKFGKRLSQIESGDRAGEKIVRFGRPLGIDQIH